MRNWHSSVDAVGISVTMPNTRLEPTGLGRWLAGLDWPAFKSESPGSFPYTSWDTPREECGRSAELEAVRRLRVKKTVQGGGSDDRA